MTTLPPKIMIDPFSVCACPLTLICQQKVMGTATSFFWKYDSKTYLISNWHVFSGREPSSGQPKDRKFGALPDSFQIAGVTKNNLNEPFTLTIPIVDSNNKNIWIQHKKFGRSVDVAAIEIDRILKSLGYSDVLDVFPCLNEAPQVTDMGSMIGQDVFILGFPLNIMKTGTFPIWKRASIATEFDFPIDGLPCFLVDTATREGMSGSAVIQRASSYTQKGGGNILAGPLATQVLGIYSGRHIGELGEAQLGIVWKCEIIEEILRDPAAGDSSFS